MGIPITLVTENGLPITRSDALGIAATPKGEGGFPCVLVDSGSFAVAFVEDGGAAFWLTGTEVSAVPVTPFTSWIALGGATKSAESGTFLGLYDDAARIISGGSINDRARTTGFSLSGSTAYEFSFIYKAGTSGRVRCIIGNTTAGNDTILSGAIGSVGETLEDAGAVTSLTETMLTDDIYQLSGTITTGASGTFILVMGPDTATATQYVIAIAAWVKPA